MPLENRIINMMLGLKMIHRPCQHHYWVTMLSLASCIIVMLSIPSVSSFVMARQVSFGTRSVDRRLSGGAPGRMRRLTELQASSSSPSSAGGAGMSNPRSSSSSATARDSAAALGEWEPMTELQRRVDEGVHYEHHEELPCRHTRRGSSSGEHDIPTVRGVFCGYRVTKEEYSRLKSAHPGEASSD